MAWAAASRLSAVPAPVPVAGALACALVAAGAAAGAAALLATAVGAALPAAGAVPPLAAEVGAAGAWAAPPHAARSDVIAAANPNSTVRLVTVPVSAPSRSDCASRMTAPSRTSFDAPQESPSDDEGSHCRVGLVAASGRR